VPVVLEVDGERGGVPAGVDLAAFPDAPARRARASNGEIAGDLFLSEATVQTYVTRDLAKRCLRARVQAVVMAYEHGLVRPGEGEGEPV
jgi:predicted transcriptional regulator